MFDVRAGRVGEGGALVKKNKPNITKLNKELYMALLAFVRSSADLDYDTEAEFRKTLKDYIETKGLQIDDSIINELISHMSFKSWEY
jgi:hypothetical protein